MYRLIRQPSPLGDRLFEVSFLDAGVEAFAFTFGCHLGLALEGTWVTPCHVALP
jgi:Thioredoxin like C-terminal domain